MYALMGEAMLGRLSLAVSMTDAENDGYSPHVRALGRISAVALSSLLLYCLFAFDSTEMTMISLTTCTVISYCCIKAR